VVGAAGAAGISVEELSATTRITAASLGSVSFQTESVTVACPLTLTGTFESGELPIVTEGAEFGVMSSTSIGRCTNGTLTRALNLSWYAMIGSILGALYERVTGQQLTLERPGLNFSMTVAGRAVECLYEGNMEMLWAVRGTNPYTTGLLRSLATRVPLNRERSNALCPASGRLNGGFSMTEQTLTMALDSEDMIPNRWAVAFHGPPAINNYMFTFRNEIMANVTVDTAAMTRGGKGFNVPATECNATIIPTNTCTATVTLTPPALSWDAVGITGNNNLKGRAWVYP
jgi:hypothetical protein